MVVFRVGGLAEPRRTPACDAFFGHDPGDAIASDLEAPGLQFGVHAGAAVGSAALAVDRLDLDLQLLVSLAVL